MNLDLGSLTALLVATAALTRWLTRWQATRSAERRDTLSQLQEAYQTALERVARVEGRADEQSRAVIAAQQQLSDERVKYGAQINELSIRVAQLETEREQLRIRIAALEAERDQLAAELAGRPRHPTPRDIPAQPTRPDAPPRR